MNRGGTEEDPRSMDHSLCGTHTYLSTKGSVYVFNVLSNQAFAEK